MGTWARGLSFEGFGSTSCPRCRATDMDLFCALARCILFCETMVATSFPLPRALSSRPTGLDALRGRPLIELCCSPESSLSAVGQEYQMTICRVTAADRFDLPRGLAKARRFIGNHPGMDALAALPCTAWCTWQFINEAKLGPAFSARLAWRRQQSIKMVGHAETCLLDAIRGGGGGDFEWPRRCRGWQRRRVKAMVKKLRLLISDFDGCAVGVEASPGVLALKPWRGATSRPGVATPLRQLRCTMDHVRGSLSGSAALRFGFYTRRLCVVVLRAIAANVSSIVAPPLFGHRLPRGCRGRGHTQRRSRHYPRSALLALRPASGAAVRRCDSEDVADLVSCSATFRPGRCLALRQCDVDGLRSLSAKSTSDLGYRLAHRRQADEDGHKLQMNNFCGDVISQSAACGLGASELPTNEFSEDVGSHGGVCDPAACELPYL